MIYSDWAVFLKTMATIEDKNIPSRRGQRLIQVQLIYSLQFVTTIKKNTTTKILHRIFNAVGPGLPRKKQFTGTDIFY